MGLKQMIVKPKTKRGVRALEKKEPKIYENVKQTMLIKGGKTSLIVSQTLKELHMLKKPHSVSFKRKNITRPFEDQTTLELFSAKSESSLFVFGSHSKKRPNNIVIGRMFDYHVLDMVEFGIDQFKSMFEYQGKKPQYGCKPCILFSGDRFDTDEEYQRMKNLLIDFFRGNEVKNVRLAGLESVISIVAADDKIYIKSYSVLLKKSGSRTPRVELEEVGPSFTMSVRRCHLGSHDLYKKALKIPRTAKPKKKRNISHDAFGTKHGRIHMQRQDMGKLQTRKLKGLKKRKQDATASSEDGSSKKAKTVAASSEDGSSKKAKTVAAE